MTWVVALKAFVIIMGVCAALSVMLLIYALCVVSSACDRGEDEQYPAPRHYEPKE